MMFEIRGRNIKQIPAYVRGIKTDTQRLPLPDCNIWNVGSSVNERIYRDDNFKWWQPRMCSSASE